MESGRSKNPRRNAVVLALALALGLAGAGGGSAQGPRLDERRVPPVMRNPTRVDLSRILPNLRAREVSFTQAGGGWYLQVKIDNDSDVDASSFDVRSILTFPDGSTMQVDTRWPPVRRRTSETAAANPAPLPQVAYDSVTVFADVPVLPARPGGEIWESNEIDNNRTFAQQEFRDDLVRLLGQPQFGVSPTALVLLGISSRPDLRLQMFTVTNTGPLSGARRQVRIVGTDAAQFRLKGSDAGAGFLEPHPAERMLAPQAAETFRVEYVFQGQGLRQHQAHVEIETEGRATPLRVQLTAIHP